MNPINGIWQWVIQGQYGIPQEGLGRTDANYKVVDAVICTERLIRTQLFSNGTPTNNRGGPGPAPSVPGYHLDEGVGGAPRDNARPCRARHRPPRLRPHPPEKPCSIAAVASLLADSNAILQRYSHGLGTETETETVSYKTISHEEMLTNCRFRLGTFDAGE